MTDDADAISQKIRKARTDPDPLPATLEELQGRAEAQNLIGIYAALSGRTAQDVFFLEAVCDGCGHCGDLSATTKPAIQPLHALIAAKLQEWLA